MYAAASREAVEASGSFRRSAALRTPGGLAGSSIRVCGAASCAPVGLAIPGLAALARIRPARRCRFAPRCQRTGSSGLLGSPRTARARPYGPRPMPATSIRAIRSAPAGAGSAHERRSVGKGPNLVKHSRSTRGRTPWAPAKSSCRRSTALSLGGPVVARSLGSFGEFVVAASRRSAGLLFLPTGRTERGRFGSGRANRPSSVAVDARATAFPPGGCR